ncbi:nanoRNase/pAp phosphatase (c-di-AMP/oligoRNAs hydrolase) [Desulfobaculum xiamenense]|uniref:NanoRNase/pAp phosphatase (C-di-AMP/oligoRNAs hydrolase) n=1 Tax=Desulfobaculum xiamenense TaxID=995050 RepID=A0A846QKC7_9BACT|nr:exopolyphosphatase [Desulfobaculum xiamenense]NJB66922.1 nanoRNase/pAp phosphatase (c-di-AMP/oligoRNAs hydrolase) [Desulfobaculum xiamenense]
MRLLTRSDFDGLICAVLLNELGLIDEWKFAHPKDLQDGTIEVTSNDILANVPYVKGCGMWFDHHSSEGSRLGTDFQFEGMYKMAPSAARVIWDYYGGHEKFPESFDDMLVAVDKVDSANLTQDEILKPSGWILLGFIMDPRTGLGRFRDYRISNYRLMEDLIEYCRAMPVDKILALPDVKERVDRYLEQEKLFRQMLEDNTSLHGKCAVIDLRNQDLIYAGNRFMIYALYPQVNISIHVLWGLNRQNVVFTVGKSIIDRSSKTDVGKLMLRYGGGGHAAVGTCQVPVEQAEDRLKDIIAEINADG